MNNYCRICGRQLEPDTEYCPKCGKPVNPEEPVQQNIENDLK